MMTHPTNTQIEIRKSILKMVYDAQASHVGSCLSIVDILYTLYFHILNIDPKNPCDPNRDIFILSKAHGSAALYAVLAEKGFFPKSNLNGYYIDGGCLPGHLDCSITPGVEVSAGSLGHGLSIGLGMAIASKNDQKASHFYILLGDGECNEGVVWEAAFFASTMKMNNLTVIIDYNKLQSYAETKDILGTKNLAAMWESFGWQVIECNGHDVAALKDALQTSLVKPKCIVAHTIKGKGVSYMENRLEWHYKSPDESLLEHALSELDSQQ